MRTRAMVVLFMALVAAPARAALVTVDDFSDILFWTGSGTNEAALVLQFPTAVESGTATPTSIAWGYRWDDPTASAADMVFALAGQITGSDAPQPVAGADARLAIDADYFSTMNAYFIKSFSYDQVGLPSPWSQDIRSMANDFDNDLGIAFYTFVANSPNASGAWPMASGFSVSSAGMAGALLADGGWYGFLIQEYDTNFEFPATVTFTQPVSAVPEPSGVALLACGGAIVGAMAWRRRRQRAA